MGKGLPRLRKAQVRGQSLLELALALPVLLLIFLGLIEVALMMRAQLVLTNANREAARYAGRGAQDEDVALRAVASFAKQLPARTVAEDGEEANTGIIITRFRIPADSAEEASFEIPIYMTGTFTYTNREGEGRFTGSQIDPVSYTEKLKTQNAGFLTVHEVVIVETYYHHHQVLHAPLVQWFIPEPMILYVRTAMRIARSSQEE